MISKIKLYRVLKLLSIFLRGFRLKMGYFRYWGKQTELNRKKAKKNLPNRILTNFSEDYNRILEFLAFRVLDEFFGFFGSSILTKIP